MRGPRPSTCHGVCLLVILLVSGGHAACNSNATSQLTPTSKPEISSSSLRQDLSPDCVRLNSCTDVPLGGWCPKPDQSVNWLEVNFPSVVNLTCLTLQVPFTPDSDNVPTVTQFRVLYENGTDQYGSLTTYATDTGAEVIDANYGNETGTFELELGFVLARRIRVEVVNYTIAPCLRLDVQGFIVDQVPLVPTEPTVSIDFTSVNDMSLKCEIKDPEIYNLQHFVTWFRDGAPVLSELLISGERISSLNVTGRDFSSQQQHYCEIRSCYEPFCSDGENGTYSSKSKSNIYVPGMQIVNGESTLALSEGEVKTVRLVFSAPPALLCVIGGLGPDCKVLAAATVQDDSPLRCSGNQRVLPQLLFPHVEGSNARYSASQCSLPIGTGDWEIERSIPVTPNSGAGLDGVYRSTITLAYSLDGNFNTNNAQSLQLNSTFTGRQAVCESLSITHVKTFDDKRYENYVQGEFVLYQHTTLPFEIRTFWKDCENANNGAQRARCQCGVAARIGDDVILLTRCMGEDRMVPKLFTGKTPAEKFYARSYYDGMRYEITMPTGGRLVAEETYQGSMNVWYYAGLADFNSTSGLCGTYDSDNTNDISTTRSGVVTANIDEFATSWRVDPADSYYNGRCATGHTAESGPLQAFSQCLSTDSVGSVDIIDSYLTCYMFQEFDLGADVTSFLKATQTSPGNCVEGDNLGNVFSYDSTTDSSDKPSSYPVNWDENTAREECERTVNTSAVAEKCPTSLLSEEDIANCMSDIKLTGDSGWSRTSIELLKERCRNVYGQAGPPNAVLNVMCPQDCSSQGRCTQGSCACSPDFGGADCSYNTSVAPQIQQLVPAQCNILVDTCDSVIIFGDGFLNTADLACYIQSIEVTASNFTTVMGITEASKTTFVSSNQVRCNLPSAGNYLIFVANRNDLKSNGVPFITLNPACFDCTENTTCMQKSNKCFINDVCYDDLEQNAQNNTLLCNATNNPLQWSMKLNPCPGSEPEWESGIPTDTALVFHNDETVSNVSSVQECRNLCLENVQLPCQSVEYDSKRQDCHMSKTTRKSASDYMLPVNGFTHDEWVCKNDRCEGQAVQWTEQADTVSGTNIEILNDVWTISNCRRQCQENVQCEGINFLSLRGVCILTSINSGKEPEAAPGWIHETFACRNDSDSSGSSNAVTMASVVANFAGPGNDEFRCDFPLISEGSSGLQYDVLWAVDGTWIYESTRPNSTYLPEEFNELRYGTTLQCAVSVCEAHRCEDTRGPLTTSTVYRVEIKVENVKDLVIRESEIGDPVTVRATAPPYVLCRGKIEADTDDCQIDIKLSTVNIGSDPLCPNATSVPQVSFLITKDSREQPACSLSFLNSDWQSTYTVSAKAVADQLYDGDHVINQTISIDYVVGNKINGTELFQAVQITVVDMDSQALCMSVNDPHITTFDGRLFHNFFEGEFVLYRHKTQPYEVRAFYRKCAGGRASCNCAVAIRAGDDVILIDKCGPVDSGANSFYPMTTKMFRKGTLTPGFRVLSQYEGREYKVVFPSGTILRVERSSIKSYHYINVWLKPSPSDYGQTEGNVS
ncbi:uncharacterized protein LOC101855535 [Aplysia californica]|uniref:Uncharacterized protein LOC101855535 n=1 Tax=Aplysia californica TaxID=6500 RepID=A0ABM1AFU9_APLCA|nr:uncharacterized protein LOC101855535 [Aplysia californica]